MSLPGISGEELKAWVENMASEWRQLLAAHPEALAIPCDIRETTNVAGLLQHIVAVELRYAQRLNEQPETAYEDVPSDSVESIFATHDQAMAMLDNLKGRDEAFWNEWFTMTTRKGGTFRAQRRIVYGHLLLHAIRHYAQLATLLRQHDLAPTWQMDFIAMAVPGLK
ncbi:DinB family protein [Silvibacterium acidisoli]|uniref:DinB family protein n=1 Tax=Acidobacteriaceae bacterium ZG23-2 TaxID=2883246 RepID=UPI00406CD81C